jgi:hypothetical protein
MSGRFQNSFDIESAHYFFRLLSEGSLNRGAESEWRNEAPERKSVVRIDASKEQ